MSVQGTNHYGLSRAGGDEARKGRSARLSNNPETGVRVA
jgi:hypothetical protein